MLKRTRRLSLGSTLALAMLASGSGPAVSVIAAETGLVLAPAASRNSGIGSITAGREHACAVRARGTVECWGGNFYGQSTPPAGTFSQIDSGWIHTCGLKTDGTAACWGDNLYNQSTPAAGTFTQLAAG